MKISITARKFEPSDKLKNYIHSRLKRIEKICKGANSCSVILQKESRAEKVELIIKDSNNTYISKCYSSRFEKTIEKKLHIVALILHFILDFEGIAAFIADQKDTFMRMPGIVATDICV